MPRNSRRAIRKLLKEASLTLGPPPRRGRGSPQQAAEKEIRASTRVARQSLSKARRQIVRDPALGATRLRFDRLDRALTQVETHALPLPPTLLELIRAREVLGGDVARLDLESGQLIAELQRIIETLAASHRPRDPAKVREAEKFVLRAKECVNSILGELDRCLEVLRGVQFEGGDR